jgi:sulfur-oxidizing protein SoxB
MSRPHLAAQAVDQRLQMRKSAELAEACGGFLEIKEREGVDVGAVGPGRSVLLDGGDLWQGTGLANAMKGADMVEAANLLGIEAMTGHWEFTYGEPALRRNLARFTGEFLAQNVFLTEEAAFNDATAFDPASGRVFQPSSIREIGGHRIAVIGQAFPYLPIAHPKRFTPDWTFGIRDDELQKLVTGLRNDDKVDAVVLLSHNGMDVDLKLASRVSGIDVILGGHTHDAVPLPIPVTNAGGTTLVTNAGSNGKFLGVLDLELTKGRISQVRYRLFPVFSELLNPDAAMAALIEKMREPRAAGYAEKIATADRLLYRRGNFNGPMDQLICDALRGEFDAEIALSPGFRWGLSVLPGQPLTMEDILSQTAMSYPETYLQTMTGGQIKGIMEDVCDNLFNADPYYQQGGDMVRIGGMSYSCTPGESIGRRISDLKLDDGRAIKAGSNYKVAGWASVNQQDGTPVWDVLARYLRSGKIREPRGGGVALRGVDDNPGIAGPG